MEQIILSLHIVLAVFLIGLVLIQKGKGASMGSAFGSGASQTLFGSRGSIGFLFKLTVFIAILFFATSITLTYFAMQTVKNSSQKTDLLTGIENLAKISQQQQQPANTGTSSRSDTAPAAQKPADDVNAKK